MDVTTPTPRDSVDEYFDRTGEMPAKGEANPEEARNQLAERINIELTGMPVIDPPQEAVIFNGVGAGLVDLVLSDVSLLMQAFGAIEDIEHHCHGCATASKDGHNYVSRARWVTPWREVSE